LKLLDAEFVTSAAAGGTPDGIPRDGIPQIAFAGRSNVGKSSLLNALCRRKIARTSAAPGKTRLANLYRATLEGGAGHPGRWSVYFVDLPGYGYARGGAKSAVELAVVAESYFTGGKRLRPERGDGLPAEAPARLRRGYGGQPSPETGAKVGVKRREAAPPSERSREWAASAKATASSAEAERRRGPASLESRPRAVLLLVDARHPGLDSDVAAAQWLEGIGCERRIVATKVDTLTRAERMRNLRKLELTFGMAALPVSAESGEGLDELWQTIANLVRR
jgi:GTP-binding protein EngB required for normal cell division